jgi:hypothetical protein
MAVLNWAQQMSGWPLLSLARPRQAFAGLSSNGPSLKTTSLNLSLLGKKFTRLAKVSLFRGWVRVAELGVRSGMAGLGSSDWAYMSIRLSGLSLIWLGRKLI